MATIIEYHNGEPEMIPISDYISYPNSGHKIVITKKTITIETSIASFQIDLSDEGQYEIVEYNPTEHKITFRHDNLDIPGTMCARYYRKFRIVIGCDDKLWYCEGYIKDRDITYGVLGTQLKYETNEIGQLGLQYHVTPENFLLISLKEKHEEPCS